MHAGSMRDARPWLPAPETAAAVLVTGSQELRDEVARVAAAAGLDLTVAATLTEAQLLRAPVLLVGSDCTGRAAPGREVILVSLSGDEDTVWEAAVRLGAGRVAVLPPAADWLAERFARLRSAVPAGRVVGVLGSSGGAGSSTLCCWLALSAAASGTSTLLMDGDLYGGGLELAVGTDTVPGVRWGDVGEVRGTLNPDQFAGSLPVICGFAVLSTGGQSAHDPAVLASPAVPPVMEAARRAFDLTIVDLPRSGLPDGSLLPFCDDVVLVVPGRLRPMTAARLLARQLQPVATWVLARGPLNTDFDPLSVAEAVGAPLAGYLPKVRGVAAAESQGRLLDLGRHRAVRRAATAALASISQGARQVSS